MGDKLTTDQQYADDEIDREPPIHVRRRLDFAEFLIEIGGHVLALREGRGAAVSTSGALDSRGHPVTVKPPRKPARPDLTPTTIRAIRERAITGVESPKALAREFQVHRSAVSAIKAAVPGGPGYGKHLPVEKAGTVD